jgi:hypothetical protein
MSYDSGIRYLNSKLEEYRASIINGITQGTLPEGEYRRLCGVLQGLDYAMNLNNDLAKRMENDTDE